MKESKYKSYQDLPRTLTAPEVSEVLGSPEPQPMNWFTQKASPHMKIGTRILIPRDKFLDWIDGQTETAV